MNKELMLQILEISHENIKIKSKLIDLFMIVYQRAEKMDGIKLFSYLFDDEKKELFKLTKESNESIKKVEYLMMELIKEIKKYE